MGWSAPACPRRCRLRSPRSREGTSPLIFWRKELRPGSGGQGRTRGGLGQEIEIESGIGEPFELLAAFDRIEFPARGRNGGGDGAPGTVAIKGGARMQGKGTQLVRPGERLLVKTPGGGGLGPAGARDPARVDQDRREGRN
ncbi:MAG TPA: hydantoinase B/oxoprolinase family protein [Hyphomicrobiaceae bacterium]|nr:hydantoinase B/oxoprolinase family protein [Hyphomicrobiaceae bacterium]